MNTGQLNDHLNKHLKQAQALTSHCYIEGCVSKAIRSHSISKARYLAPISKDGTVYTVDMGGGPNFRLKAVGKNNASVFPGFCDEHDKMFLPIDNSDYSEGNLEQQFLFAFRAAAREFFARAGAIEMSKNLAFEAGSGQFGYSTKIDVEAHRDFMVGFEKGFSDMKKLRGRLNAYLAGRKYGRLHTYVLKMEPGIPLAASSAFHIEADPDGTVVTDVRLTTGLLRPCLFTVFPQGEHTYALITIDIRDRHSYDWIERYETMSNRDRQLAVSNLLINHVENFAVSPDYWNSLAENTRRDFALHFAGTLQSPDLIDSAGSPNINLFISPSAP